jgi:hypothetical protein
MERSMGNGTKTTPDVAKHRPRAGYTERPPMTIAVPATDDDTVAAGRAAGSGTMTSGGSPPTEPIDFCERSHLLRFSGYREAAPHLGQAVQLVLAVADAPHVVSATGAGLGSIDDPTWSALRQCLIAGYVFAGKVVAVENAGRYATVRVTGRLVSDLG